MKISRTNTGERKEKKELIGVAITAKPLCRRVLEISQAHLVRLPSRVVCSNMQPVKVI